MIFLIAVVALLAIAVVVFVTWFLAMKAEGKCPICALKHILSSKITMDISDEKDYENGAPTTPIMGWSSWNTFRNHINEDMILETAQAIKETGLADAGYQYINLDDCWHSSMRDKDGLLQGDLESFPSGIAKLTEQVNELGLKMGIYSSNGTLTCEDLPASLGNEELDAKTFASWGIEFFKYDFCHNIKISGSTPMIEYIELSRPGQHAEIKLEPEAASFTGMARVVNCKDLPTKKGIGYLNHNAGTATFNIDSTGGEYNVTIHFYKMGSGKKQYLQFVVNNKVHEVFFPDGKSFTADGRMQLSIKLKEGENVIRLQNPIVTKADSAYIQYKRMADALVNASKAWAAFSKKECKPITFSICEWGRSNPHMWGGKAGNMWRTTGDIMANWISIRHIYEKNIELYKYASPGHFNDPDMLEVGNGKLTTDENRAHFTLWCMMAAPLVLGNDVRKLLDGSDESKSILDIITNKSLILVDQDPLAKPAKRIKKAAVDIIARPLYNGDTVVCFFNKSSASKTLEFEINSLKEDSYLDFNISAGGYHIHDLWDDDRTHGDIITAAVPSHGVKVYRISR